MTGTTGRFPKERRAMTEERAVREQIAEFALAGLIEQKAQTWHGYVEGFEIEGRTKMA
jgi:hypothetical protein